MTLSTAPDCARCDHPARRHSVLGYAVGTCFTDTTGAEVVRAEDSECPCSSYSPAADTERPCPECDGVGLTMTFGGPDDCPTCAGAGRL